MRCSRAGCVIGISLILIYALYQKIYVNGKFEGKGRDSSIGVSFGPAVGTHKATWIFHLVAAHEIIERAFFLLETATKWNNLDLLVVALLNFV
jgi:hypothetical protein